MNYIAIDVSKENLVVFDGKKLRSFPNARGLTSLRKFIVKEFELTQVVLIFEPTGPYSTPLLTLAAQLSILVYIVNPAQAHWFSKALGNRRKDDSTDAVSLYNFAQFFARRGIAPTRVDQSLLALSHLLSTYRHLQKQAQALKNHIEALNFSNYSRREFVNSLVEEAKRLDELKQEAFNRAKQLVLKDEKMRKDYRRLKTIPGVGEKTALWLLWLFNRYSGAGRRQIIALCGLDVVIRESGSSIRGRAHISKQGNSAIRAITYFPTFTAIKYNPAIGAFYQHLLSRGKKKKLAAVACMRKLILIAYALWKSKKALG